MTCEELRGEYELLALGILDRSERAELDEHLNRGCGECTKGLRRAYVTNAYIMTMAPDVPMPRSLRKRVTASVAAERRNWSWITAISAVLASVLLVFGWFGLEDRQKSEAMVTFIKASDTRQYAFPRGRVFVNPSRGVLLLASNLPELNTGKTFELWVIPKGGTPKAAGLFASSGNGSATHMYSGQLDVERTAAVAVSIESASGSPAPTTTPILVVPLTD
jgi:anti-sigma-K factor RskA